MISGTKAAISLVGGHMISGTKAAISLVGGHMISRTNAAIRLEVMCSARQQIDWLEVTHTHTHFHTLN